MRMAAVLGALAFSGLLAACGWTPTGCPRTIDEARQVVDRETFVGGGWLIRYVPSPDRPDFRGYDVNITTPVSPAGFLDTAFLRVPDEIPGVNDGDPVLLVGRREGRVLVHPGPCPPLTVIDAEELDW